MKVLISVFLLTVLIACESENDKAIESIRQEIQEFREKENDIDRELGSTNNIGTAPKSKGKAGEFEAEIRGVMNEGISFRNAYENELLEAGFDVLLDADRLHKDANFTRSYEIISESREVMERYHNKSDDFMDRLKYKVESKLLTGNESKDDLKALDQRFYENKEIIKESFLLELNLLQEYESLVKWIASIGDDWEPIQGQFAFHNQEDIEVFNQYISKIQNVSKKDDELRKKTQGRTDESLEKLK